ncbi:MAG: DUF4296 domain-containing protein [Rikenellaceae bacterium]|jgi:hypothetical protein|nr:DUF4296 domain-containing protein [Rikenellaceae bacterium]
MRKLIVCLFFLLPLLSASCGRPRTIPDGRFEKIIRELLLTNSYISYHGQSINNDSVDFYTPILKKYGYTEQDFRYSLGKMAMRKSSRITDVVDSALVDILKADSFYKGRAEIARRMEIAIRNIYKDTVYSNGDTVIRVRNREDLKRLTLKLPVSIGDYEIRFRYRIDSIDDANYHSAHLYLTNRLSPRMNTSYSTLKKGAWDSISLAVSARDTAIRSLTVIYDDYPTQAKRPNITVERVRVIYTPLVDSVRNEAFNRWSKFDSIVRFSIKDTYHAQDSGTLHLLSPLRLDTAGRVGL